MSKPLDKKLQEYIMNMASKYLPFGGREWNSSAQNLEDVLKGKGIDKKLFYKYKLPDDMKPQQLQDQITIECFCDKFYTYFASRVLKDKQISLSDKMQITRYVWEMRRMKKYRNMKYYADEIRRLNPELADINTKIDSALVHGALFGFAPDEIKYFCEVAGLRDFDKEHKLDRKLKRRGVDTSYVLAPETAMSLIATLRKQKRKL